MGRWRPSTRMSIRTKGTSDYMELLDRCRRELGQRRLRWGNWTKLASSVPTKKSLLHAVPVQEIAARHIEHPQLREEMRDLVRLVFDVASKGLAAYQSRKRERGLLDFGDQEVLALDLLGRPEVCGIKRAARSRFGRRVPGHEPTAACDLSEASGVGPAVRLGGGSEAGHLWLPWHSHPSLMDAAIESLTNPSRDPDLVAAAIEAVSAQSREVERLSTSYRSRPDLVAVTNAVFTKAFESQGMAGDRVRLSPVRSESETLGAAVAHFRLEVQGRSNAELALALAEGVRVLIESQPQVWDRDLGAERPARPSDVAILCRTNEQCANVARLSGRPGSRLLWPGWVCSTRQRRFFSRRGCGCGWTTGLGCGSDSGAMARVPGGRGRLCRADAG